MSKVFVIPDVHLKPRIFDKAEEYISKGSYDKIVFLGDLIDDWGQENNEALYYETFKRLYDFIKKHDNFFYCYGNHDISYIWDEWQSGFSRSMKGLVVQCMGKLKSLLPEENIAFIHKIDNVLFSHAGLSKAFVDYYFPDHRDYDIDTLIKNINKCGRGEMWNDASPIWARPQDGGIKKYSDCLQVVGHTPVEKTDYFDGILTVDNFSTYRDGTFIGDQRFVWVDTITKEWGFVDKGGEIERNPDEKLDIRSYETSDIVKFKVGGRGIDEEICEGPVKWINYSAYNPSVDVIIDKVLYRNISLKDIIEHQRPGS